MCMNSIFLYVRAMMQEEGSVLTSSVRAFACVCVCVCAFACAIMKVSMNERSVTPSNMP